MDKRIGWNFDSGQHATFNPLRPVALRRSKTVLWRPHSKTNSQFRRSRGRFLDENRIIGGPAINMRIFHRRLVLRAGVVALILIVLWAIAIGPEPPARATNLHPEKPCMDGQDLLSFALDGGHPEIIKTVMQRLPMMPEWTASTRRALSRALQAGKNDEIRLLLSKHSAPPTPEGKNVPFLAYAIASSNVFLFSTLLNSGADPNTVLPSRCDKDFLALLPNGLRSYIEEDRSVTLLMLASGLGQVDYLKALIDGGANRTRLTTRNKMSALDVAAETGHWRSAQILLGGGPAPDKLRIEISLAMQRVALVRDGKPIYQARCSTGRSGYSTKRGEFVITNKERTHRSTIYHVEMPYFMRLSCLDFGMHAGYVPNYPASHGCIRLPEDTARKFFSEIPVGTLVTVQ